MVARVARADDNNVFNLLFSLLLNLTRHHGRGALFKHLSKGLTLSCIQPWSDPITTYIDGQRWFQMFKYIQESDSDRE